MKADTLYVVTKVVDGSRSGRFAYNRETVQFGSGQSGLFGKGTVCRSNGRLKALAAGRSGA